jgi:DNA-directed RNA polymerase subunit RPC12/RpoP
MLKELIEYECPNCHAGYGALERRAGMETACAYCKTGLVIPVGLRPRLVSVGECPLMPASRPGLIRALVEHFRSSFTKLFLALRGYAKRF